MTHSDIAATHNPPALLNHKQLARMRNSPVARLLAGSIWILKAWQLDLEFPLFRRISISGLSKPCATGLAAPSISMRCTSISRP